MTIQERQHTIYITQSDGRWTVRAEGSRPKLFATKDAALRAALMLKHDSGNPGPIEIQVLDDTGLEASFTAASGALTFDKALSSRTSGPRPEDRIDLAPPTRRSARS